MGQAAGAQDPVQHHFVPRSYLAYFTRERTTDRGRIWTYTRNPDTPPDCKPLDSVAFERHLYTRPGDDGTPSAALERHLAREIERPFMAWRRTIACAPRGKAQSLLEAMSLRQGRAVARYVAYQHLRTPAMRAFMHRLGDFSRLNFLSGRETQAELEAEWRRRDPKARLPMTHAERRWARKRWTDECHEFLVRWQAARPHSWLDPIEKFAEALVPSLVHERAWRIAELPRDIEHEKPFITCDTPVVLVHPRSGAGTASSHASGWDGQIGGGWHEPELQASLTLSPRHALVLGRSHAALSFVDDTPVVAEVLRVRTVRHAFDHVYARDEDDTLADLVRATSKPQVLFEVAGVAIPGTAPAREVLRRVQASRVDQIWVRYAA